MCAHFRILVKHQNWNMQILYNTLIPNFQLPPSFFLILWVCVCVCDCCPVENRNIFCHHHLGVVGSERHSKILKTEKRQRMQWWNLCARRSKWTISTKKMIKKNECVLLFLCHPKMVENWQTDDESVHRCMCHRCYYCCRCCCLDDNTKKIRKFKTKEWTRQSYLCVYNI